MVVLKCHLKLRFTQIIPFFLPSQPPQHKSQLLVLFQNSKLDKLLQAVFPPQVAK